MFHLFTHFIFQANNNLDLGPVRALSPGSTAASVAYFTIPRFLNVPTLAARCISRPQPEEEELRARNGGQMVPGICTQVSFTCRKSATWDR